MAFNGTEGAPINLDKAAVFTANYRTDSPGETKAHYIGRDILNNILNQDGCMGIRVYYGKDENGNKQLIFVGATANEDDMVNGVIADYSFPCPNRCATSNALNTDQ